VSKLDDAHRRRESTKERYLSKSNALDEGPGEEQEGEHRVAAFALWRPMNRLALLGRLPYALKEITTRPQAGPTTTDRAHGLGDAELLAMVGVAQTAGRHPLTLGLVAGAAAPTGPNDLKDANGDRLDAHLQTGTGALYNAGFISRARSGMRLVMQLNGRSAAHDRLEDANTGENTGGTVLYATPGVRWVSTLGLSVEAAVQIPVAQALYGTQTEHTTARVSLAMSR